jgi:hypothetical protein
MLSTTSLGPRVAHPEHEEDFSPAALSEVRGTSV